MRRRINAALFFFLRKGNYELLACQLNNNYDGVGPTSSCTGRAEARRVSMTLIWLVTVNRASGFLPFAAM